MCLFGNYVYYSETLLLCFERKVHTAPNHNDFNQHNNVYYIIQNPIDYCYVLGICTVPSLPFTLLGNLCSEAATVSVGTECQISCVDPDQGNISPATQPTIRCMPNGSFDILTVLCPWGKNIYIFIYILKYKITFYTLAEWLFHTIINFIRVKCVNYLFKTQMRIYIIAFILKKAVKK